MGRLLEDVAEDRERLERETKALLRHIIVDAKEAVEIVGRLPNPLLAAIVGSDAITWQLGWRSQRERRAVVKRINTYLTDNNATSTIFVYQKDTSVVVAVETPSARKLFVMPYTLKDGEITWGQLRTARRFRTPFSGPSLN